jgi:hypothetical protein
VLVNVDAPDETPRSAGLLLVGIAALGSLFLYANPSFGWHHRAWPWEVWTGTDALHVRADLLLWVVTGTVALLSGAGALGRAGPLVLLPLVLLLCLRSLASPAAIEASRATLLALASSVALGAGFVACAGPATAGGRAAARLSCLGGALAAVLIHVLTFPSRDPSAHASLAYHLDDVQAALRGSLPPREVWGRVVPFLAEATAVVLALLVAAIPGRSGVVRALGALGFVVVLLPWLVPACLRAAETWEEIRGSAAQAADLFGDVWFEAGLGLFLLASLALASLVARAGRAPDAPA